MVLQPSKQRQFLEQQVKSLYKSWVQTQQELKEITDPAIKGMWVEELTTLYKQAQLLLEEPLIQGSTSLSYLKIILSRSPEQWAVLVKADNKPLL
jgi:hypothetical protein